MERDPVCTITMETGEKIVIRLLPDIAPNTVASFIWLAEKGCFDSHPIERIVPGYVADMSYSAFGRDYAKYMIRNEAPLQKGPRHIPPAPGTVAMGGYEEGIAGGEFFFPFALSEKIDGNYPVFGLVLEGMDTILSWQNVPLREVPSPMNGVRIMCPVDPIIIRSVSVEKFGMEFPEPERIPFSSRPHFW